jgi:hypothetical protein
MLTRLLDQVRDLSKDSDHVLAAKEWYGAHFDANSAAIRADYLDVGVCDPRRADDLSREELPSAPVSSGETTDVNCSPRTSPTILSAAGFTQRMMPVASMT